MSFEDLANIMFPNLEHDIDYYENLYKDRCLEDGKIVTRFAPSPTGFVHMGSLLTAFIARKVTRDTNGVFYLRIEDTDQKRSVENGITGMIKDLKDFDINLDEGQIDDSNYIGEYGPYIQSERLDIYNAYLKYMVINDLAYPCFLTEEELVEMRDIQEKNKERIGCYSKYAKYRDLSNEERIKRIKNGESYVIRLKSQGNFNKKIVLNDLVRGKIEFPENDMDVVLVKSNGIPVYHFAHVIDDHLMYSTHILRGEEWLSSVPVHLELFKMLGFKAPKYAHLALVMKNDNGVKRKLSKRKDPEAAVSFYHEKGIPVDAVKLYLLTIANSNFEDWMNTNKDKSIDDYRFDFKKMSISGSLFDLDKLINISRNYISKLTAEDVYCSLLNWAKEFDKEFYDILVKYKERTIKFLSIERYQKKPRKDFYAYSDVKNYIFYMYDELFIDKYDDINIDKIFNLDILKDYVNNYYDVSDDMDTWYSKVKDLASKYNYASEVKDYKENPDKYLGHVGNICEMIRLSVTSLTMTPNLYDILKILGKDVIENRINIFIDKMKGE